MSDLDDIDYKSILNMDMDEALESFRLIRLSRRMPAKQNRQVTKKKSEATPAVDAEMAAKLLKILGGE